jgi:hypothetical protein
MIHMDHNGNSARFHSNLCSTQAMADEKVLLRLARCPFSLSPVSLRVCRLA